MRKIFVTTILLVSGIGVQPLALADGECGPDQTTIQFVRDDLSSIKHALKQVLAAVPRLNTPYGLASENWSLPSYACEDKAGIRPVDVAYTSRYTTEASLQQQGEKYQKQLMAAQAKGDYQAMMKISQAMQQAVVQQSAATQPLTPVSMNVFANVSDSGTIDPDSVIKDDAGFIAIRVDNNKVDADESISMYFDPVALKNAKQLAAFNLGGDYRVDGKLDLTNLRVDLSGPRDVVEKIAKNVDVSRVMNLLTTSRHGS